MLNKKLNHLINNGEWAIDLQFAQSQLEKYLLEIQIVSNGGSYASLGYSEKRKEKSANIITPNSSFLTKNVLSADIEKGSIAMLTLSGVMMAEDNLCSYGVRSLVNDIVNANSNPNIDGILLDVNTGGGEITAGTMLRDAIYDSQKPVVVRGHYIGSAGILGTLYANEIIAANQYAKFGSIGVYVSLNKEVLEYYKENVIETYSKYSDNKNIEYRELQKGNFEPLLKSVTKLDELFMADVKAARPLKGDVENTLSGLMFPARQAKRRGLVDGIGTLSYAIARLKSHIEVSSYNKKKKYKKYKK